jgi:hypothetical protein
MLVTDKMIVDLVCGNCDVFERGVSCCSWFTCKDSIRGKGYEIEDIKTKDELYRLTHLNIANDIKDQKLKNAMLELLILYKQALKEAKGGNE